MPDSLLDAGCGTGTWLRAAQELGVNNIFGVDGIAVEADQLLISKSLSRITGFYSAIESWTAVRYCDVSRRGRAPGCVVRPGLD